LTFLLDLESDDFCDRLRLPEEEEEEEEEDEVCCGAEEEGVASFLESGTTEWRLYVR
jgi:hypothetical protein